MNSGKKTATLMEDPSIFTGKIRFIVLIAGINLGILLILRLVFLWIYRDAVSELALADLTQALYVGVKFDIRLALLICLPPALLVWLPGLGRLEKRGVRLGWVAYLTFVNMWVLFLYMIDFGYFSYLGRRMEATAIRFAGDPLISLQMAWESYPVIWGVLGLIVFCGLYFRLVSAVSRSSVIGVQSGVQPFKKAGFHILVVSLYILGIYGTLTRYPLRWSHAFFSTNVFASAVALNPVLYVFDTFKNRELGFDVNKTRKHYITVSNYLDIERPDAESLQFTDRVPAKPGLLARPGEARPNVVIVFLESFAASHTGMFNNPLNPSPEVDKIARNGWLFTRYYSPHGGTARSVFALVSGIPDIYAPKSASRNPLVVKQRTIINDFEDHRKMYFVGGNASWGNIRGLLMHNIPGIRLYEEEDYASPHNDGWGISDHHLFEEAHSVIRGQRRDTPFFAIIQTAGNHRPYTIPEDSKGFKKLELAKEKVNRYGFSSLESYNAFRLLDHSVGYFMRLARQEAYFKNTLFVFLGDHGLSKPSPHMLPAEKALELGRFHVPLILYAPELLEGTKSLGYVASEVDVLPTIAGIVGIPYTNTTMGRDLFAERFNAKRTSFVVAGHAFPPRVGLIGKKFYLRMFSTGANPTLHDLTSATPLTDVKMDNMKLFARYQQLTLGLYETARYMLYHNAE